MPYRPTRREVLAGAGASALAASGGAMASQPVPARGVVYADGRGEGPRRPGDRGIPGVMVSNGRDVTVTGADGAWTLAVEPGDSVFVIKPPQWTTRLSPAGLPQHAYLYQPQGSPGRAASRFPVVDPTGPLPASIDFPLQPRDERPGFEALLVTDTQPDSLAELDYVRDDIMAAVLAAGGGAAFAINHGDVVSDDLSLYPRYLRLIGATGLAWHHCPGNHDVNYEAADDRFSRETWKRTFGSRHYAFQHAGATFIVLDNVEYLGGRRYRGALGPGQIAFVRNVLKQVPADRLVVLSMHIPLVCYHSPGKPANTTADWRELLQALAGHPHTVSFAGHLHTTEHHYLDGDAAAPRGAPHHHHILTAACGSWWSGPADHRGIPWADSSDGTPNGFHVLSVEGNRYTTRYVPAAGRSSAQMRVLIDGPHRLAAATAPGSRAWDRLGLAVPLDALGRCRVLANVFDGGPRTAVTLEIKGHAEPVAMTPVAAPDPLMADLFQGPTPRKSWVKASRCFHLWQAPLPPGLGAGANAMVVRARDEYGREHVVRTIVEVTQTGA